MITTNAMSHNRSSTPFAIPRGFALLSQLTGTCIWSFSHTQVVANYKTAADRAWPCCTSFSCACANKVQGSSIGTRVQSRSAVCSDGYGLVPVWRVIRVHVFIHIPLRSNTWYVTAVFFAIGRGVGALHNNVYRSQYVRVCY